MTLVAPTIANAPAAPAPRLRLRRMRYEPDPGAAPKPVLAPVLRELPDPDPDPDPVDGDHEITHRALSGALRLAMEVLDGRRPAAQLGRHFGPAPLRYWRAETHRRHVRSPARVLRIHLCLPRTGAAEVAAVCDIDGRVRALAARYERSGPGAPWRCTAVRLG